MAPISRKNPDALGRFAGALAGWGRAPRTLSACVIWAAKVASAKKAGLLGEPGIGKLWALRDPLGGLFAGIGVQNDFGPAVVAIVEMLVGIGSVFKG